LTLSISTDNTKDIEFDRLKLTESLAALAARGVFVGTSSWKYSGWCDQLYDRSRYIYRGKFAETRFERNCLSEYAETFKTVCVDAAYYSFPRLEYLTGLASQVPPGFRFSFKVTDEITQRKFPNLPRFALRAGKPNTNFLNADLFANMFLKPCEAIRDKIGLLIFEFSHFYSADYQHGRDFLIDLDSFLSRVPNDWPYGIELRNQYWLTPEYFACLARHGVTHVFNSWSAMPSVRQQMALPGVYSTPHRVAARFLLKPGRKYEDAVKLFQPYSEIREVNEEARMAGAELINLVRKANHASPAEAFIYVNNRLEGNALGTITGMIEKV
jgi:uncharacterized protein YecE (DUF72 family)